MKPGLYAAAIVLALYGVSAEAQSYNSETTTTATQTDPALAPPPPPMAPPPGTLSTTQTVRGTDAYGNTVYSKSSSYRDANGYATDRKTTTTIAAPPPPPVYNSTTTSSSTTTTTAPQ